MSVLRRPVNQSVQSDEILCHFLQEAYSLGTKDTLPFNPSSFVNRSYFIIIFVAYIIACKPNNSFQCKIIFELHVSGIQPTL